MHSSSIQQYRQVPLQLEVENVFIKKTVVVATRSLQSCLVNKLRMFRIKLEQFEHLQSTNKPVLCIFFSVISDLGSATGLDTSLDSLTSAQSCSPSSENDIVAGRF